MLKGLPILVVLLVAAAQEPGAGRYRGHAAGPAAGCRCAGRRRGDGSRDEALPGADRRRRRRRRRNAARHGAGAGRRVPAREPGKRARARRTGVPEAPGAGRFVLDGDARDDLGPLPRVHVRHRPRRRRTRSRLGRRGEQTHTALPADGLRHGRRRVSGDLDDPVRGPAVHEVAGDEDRPLLTGCRPRPSGSTPAAPAGTPRGRSATTRRRSTASPGTPATATAATGRSRSSNRTPGASSTCTAM